MMSAREYSQKYAGQAVKLSAFAQKDYGIKSDQPIGVVVGFKAGTKGIIGSSKVAVYREKHQDIGLEYFTDRKFNSVVLNPPDHRKGIFLLSVNYLDLVTPPKPVLTYPHRCGICHSPARKATHFIICSNSRCKTNKAVLNAIGPIPKYYVVDKDGYILCPHCQINDNVKNKDLEFTAKYSDHKHMSCRKNVKHTFIHPWKEGQKMFYQGLQNYIWKNGSLQMLLVKK